MIKTPLGLRPRGYILCQRKKKQLPVGRIVDLRQYDQEAVLKCQRDCYNFLRYNIAIQ